jgi:tetratricopeptide (TPR) repeat protein
MLKPKKKITKRDLKEDKLVSTYFKASEYFYQNKKYFSWGITGLVVLFVAGVIYFNNRSANEEKATTALGEILRYYDKGEYQTAINGVPEKNVVGLKDIVDGYGGTHSGDLAKFFLANCYYSMGNYDEALKYFDDFGGNYSPLRASAVAGVAACYEAKGDNKKAAEYFERAASKSGDPQSSPEYLRNAARDYALSGKKERAIELLKKLKKEYPASMYVRDADRMLAEFSS